MVPYFLWKSTLRMGPGCRFPLGMAKPTAAGFEIGVVCYILADISV